MYYINGANESHSVIRSINFLAMICQTPDGTDVSNVFGSRRKSHVGGFESSGTNIFLFLFLFILTTILKLPGFSENFQAISSKSVTTENVGKVVKSVCISRGDVSSVSTTAFQFV